jgi:hypothetical protein
MEKADAIATMIQTHSHFIPHEEKNKLIDLIGERISSKLAPIWREMIEGITLSEGYKIQEIAASRQANAQKAARYEQIRFAKVQHEKRRKETFAERGARLLDWRNAVRNSPPAATVEPTLLEEDVVSADVVFPPSSQNTLSQYQSELKKLSGIAGSSTKGIRDDHYPTALKFGFLLASISRPALRLTKNFIPLPSQKTIYNHYHDKVVSAQDDLKDLARLNAQISLFITMNQLPPG